jgi:putative SOS response-associated peptidase YedK
MCGRFDTSHLTWAQIHDALSRFAKVSTTPLNIEPNDDARPTTQQLVARLDGGEWRLDKMRWGLVPFWRNGKPLKDTEKGKGDGFKLTTFNARVEGVASASTFREAFKRRRCVVPVSGWYEWTGQPGSKVKHAFRRTDGAPVWFAGLWDEVTTPDAGELSSFTILTGPSEGMLADYHDRAPVVLEPDELMHWLDPARDPAGLLSAVRPERFRVGT